ncbi:MAG: response regulator transcription factor, partial [Acidimicrobiia bacterium]
VSLTEGFEVSGEAATGESAVTMAQDMSPDLILMDINLPGIDGLEATRQIVEASPHTKVIVMSTYEPDEYEQRALGAGAIAFMSKSDLDPDTLLAGWLGHV